MGRLLRPDSCEVGEQRDGSPGGVDGAKDRARGESGKPKHAPGTGPGKRDTGGRLDTAVRTTIRRQFNPREEPRALAGMRGSARGVPSNGDSYRDRLGESQDGFGVFIHGCCDWNF